MGNTAAGARTISLATFFIESPLHGRASVERLDRTYQQRLSTETRSSMEDLPEVMDVEREGIRFEQHDNKIHTHTHTHTHTYIYIYIYSVLLSRKYMGTILKSYLP